MRKDKLDELIGREDGGLARHRKRGGPGKNERTDNMYYGGGQLPIGKQRYRRMQNKKFKSGQGKKKK